MAYFKWWNSADKKLLYTKDDLEIYSIEDKYYVLINGIIKKTDLYTIIKRYNSNYHKPTEEFVKLLSFKLVELIEDNEKLIEQYKENQNMIKLINKTGLINEDEDWD